MKLTNSDLRSLTVIGALLLSAGAARWLDRPRPILADVPQLDLAALQAASEAQDPRRSTVKPRPKREIIAAGAPERIDPNKATVAQLMQLPGVGPALAERMRAAGDSARFRSQADLQRVPGIGPAMVAKLAPYITLPAEAPGRVTRPGAPKPQGVAGAASSQETLDLNRATARDLESIKGLGTVLAARIVARRDSLGRYRDWTEVDAVSGVGAAMLARLKERTAIRP